jgi:hypothetical protein
MGIKRRLDGANSNNIDRLDREEEKRYRRRGKTREERKEYQKISSLSESLRTLKNACSVWLLGGQFRGTEDSRSKEFWSKYRRGIEHSLGSLRNWGGKRPARTRKSGGRGCLPSEEI